MEGQTYYQRNKEYLLQRARERYRAKVATPEGRAKYTAYFRKYFEETTRPKLRSKLIAKGKTPKPTKEEITPIIKDLRFNIIPDFR